MTGTEDIWHAKWAEIWRHFNSTYSVFLAHEWPRNDDSHFRHGRGNIVLYMDLSFEVCGDFTERSQSRSLGLRGIFLNFGARDCLVAEGEPDQCCWRESPLEQ